MTDREPETTVEDIDRAFGSQTGGRPHFTAEAEGWDYLFGRPHTNQENTHG